LARLADPPVAAAAELEELEVLELLELLPHAASKPAAVTAESVSAASRRMCPCVMFVFLCRCSLAAATRGEQRADGGARPT
jgi:hypothetical protein